MCALVIQNRVSQEPQKQETEFSVVLAQSFKGDYLNLKNNNKCFRLITVQGSFLLSLLLTLELLSGDESFVFADYVDKLVRGSRSKKRVLLLTNTVCSAVYVLLMTW